MTKEGSDKVQREIEELLDRLDNFVPEERLVSKIKARSRRRDPSQGPSIRDRLARQIGRLHLGHLMLAGLALFLSSWILGDWEYAEWLTIGGLVLTGSAFVLSIVGGGRRGPSGRGGGGGRYEKRWRGQVIEYGEPSPSDRVRGWFRGRKRR